MRVYNILLILYELDLIKEEALKNLEKEGWPGSPNPSGPCRWEDLEFE